MAQVNNCKNCRHWQTDSKDYDGLGAPCALDATPWTSCSFHHSCSRHQPHGEQPVVAAPKAVEVTLTAVVGAPVKRAPTVQAKPAIEVPQADLFGA